MAEVWFDARGCLNADGMTVLRGAVPGTAAPEIAAHLAACGSCQERLLSLESASAGHGPRPEAKPPWRNLILMGAAIFLLMLAMMVTAFIVR
jgi:hypothetical protein